MKALLLTSLLLCSCGAQQENYVCDMDVDNLCIIAHGYPIAAEEISWEINKVQESVNRFFPGLDLATLIGQYQLKLSAEEQAKLGNQISGIISFLDTLKEIKIDKD